MEAGQRGLEKLVKKGLGYKEKILIRTWIRIRTRNLVRTSDLDLDLKLDPDSTVDHMALVSPFLSLSVTMTV